MPDLIHAGAEPFDDFDLDWDGWHDYDEETAWYCPDCEAYFYEDEEGYGDSECLECGSPNAYEVYA